MADLKMELSFDYRRIGKQIVAQLSRYRIILTSLAILGVFALTIVRIDAVSNPEKNQDRFAEQATGLRKVQINAEVIDVLRELEATNIDIDANFGTGRQSPFTE